MWVRVATAGVAIVALLTGCSGGLGDECTARIRLDGVVYRSHNLLNQDVRADRNLGRAEVISCGEADARVVDHVQARAVRGVDPQVAIVVGDHTWTGVYVAEGLRPSAWPRKLRNRP